MTRTHVALIALAAFSAGLLATQATEWRPRQTATPTSELGREASRAHCEAMAHSDMLLSPTLQALPPALYAAELRERLRICDTRHR